MAEDKSPQELLTEEYHKNRFNYFLKNPTVASSEERKKIKSSLKLEYKWWGDKQPYKRVEEIIEDCKNGKLLRVASTNSFKLIMRLENPDLTDWQPYASSSVISLLQRVGEAWRKKMREAGLSDDIRLPITSLVRTVKYQNNLIEQGKLAAENSSHTKGQSFDIDGCGYYIDDDVVNPRFTPNYKEIYEPMVHALLRETLEEMKSDGSLNYIPEYENTDNRCFHVTCSPNYKE